MTGETPPDPPAPRRATARIAAAAALVLAVAAALSATPVPAGTALVVTRFGRPVRSLTAPGLAWTLPAPIETVTPVDLGPRVTAIGPAEVALREGAPLAMDAAVVWQVPAEAAAIERFWQSSGGDPEAASRLVQSLATAALHAAAQGFAAGDLLSTDPRAPGLPALSARLRETLAPALARIAGIAVRDAGVTRLGPPAGDAAGGEDAAREAEGIRETAAREARTIAAEAESEAAAIEAASRRDAADAAARAYAADPQLYTLLRSMDALSAIVGRNTRLVLRTDAAPFSALVAGPPAEPGK